MVKAVTDDIGKGTGKEPDLEMNRKAFAVGTRESPKFSPFEVNSSFLSKFPNTTVISESQAKRVCLLGVGVTIVLSVLSICLYVYLTDEIPTCPHQGDAENQGMVRRLTECREHRIWMSFLADAEFYPRLEFDEEEKTQYLKEKYVEQLGKLETKFLIRVFKAIKIDHSKAAAKLLQLQRQLPEHRGGTSNYAEEMLEATHELTKISVKVRPMLEAVFDKWIKRNPDEAELNDLRIEMRRLLGAMREERKVALKMTTEQYQADQQADLRNLTKIRNERRGPHPRPPPGF